MHKTAAEMLISDWSSDVCTSDLRMVHVRSDLIEQRRIGDLAAQMQQVLRAEQAERLALFHRRHHAAEQVAARLVGIAQAADQRIEDCGDTGRRHLGVVGDGRLQRSEEPTSELQSLMRNSYAVFCLKN